MFQKARLKLTTWYLLIIMLISVSFSIGVLKILTSELDRVERVQRLRQEHQLTFEPSLRFPRQKVIDPEVIAETKERLKLTLFLINLGILGIAGVAGYFLAGKTLRPIQEMVDEQNRFITDASHELRTPITSLKTSIEVYLRDKNHTATQSDKLLESNLEEVNSLQTLSDDLIKLTQNIKENNNILFENISLTEIIVEAQKKVSNLAKHKNITIKNQVTDLTLEADKQSLVETFVILLDNAIKYSPKGKTVTITSKKTDGSILLEVKDQGFGVDEKDLPHLFDRFYRADKSRTKMDVSGYGLGLSIAKQIIDKHGGTISVESEVNKGTTFFIHLPIKH